MMFSSPQGSIMHTIPSSRKKSVLEEILQVIRRHVELMQVIVGFVFELFVLVCDNACKRPGLIRHVSN